MWDKRKKLTAIILSVSIVLSLLPVLTLPAAAVASPTVTTQSVGSIAPYTAIGYGNITDFGTDNPTQHGVV